MLLISVFLLDMIAILITFQEKIAGELFTLYVTGKECFFM